MANLGNLIVRGVTRILGDAYANKFIGNLQGNADTATSAIKASTADSATNATSANKASIATAVQDYGTSSYKEIKIGYSGSGLSSSDITHAVGFTDSGTKIKDISKDEFRNWLATASGIWNISITGNAATATDANTLDGYHADSFAKNLYLGTTDLNSIDNSSLGQQNSSDRATPELHYPVQEAGGLISISSAYSSTNQIYGTHNSNRWFARGAGRGLSSRTSWREFAFLDSNVASSSKWETPRTITLTGSVTGSVSIDGSQNVSLAATTNHTHTFASLTDKPTTISEYGIVDSIRLMNDSSDLYVGARSNYGENMTGSKYLEWWNSAGWVHHKAGKFSIHGGTSSQFLKADGSLDSTAYLTEQNLQGYATTTWVNSNYYTCSESDSRYIQSETDPVWTAAKDNYYTKTECNNKFQPKGTYLTEQNLQGYATQEWVRGEEYLYRSGGTMDARAEIGITTKLFIGNSTSSDTCYTKFNCILHGGGDESNPNWIIRDNGYAEFKSSVSANAFYASSDIRLKNILDDINIDFDKLKLIPKKYYTWKGSDILQLGTIAQDIQKIYPEVVSKNENGYLSVDYSKLSIIALAAIDKLNERIKELECQIKL